MVRRTGDNGLMRADLGDDAVAAAIRATDRRTFLPRDVRPYADEDRPLPIGHRATNSQPSTVAAMLRLLDARPGHRVLDVGAGSAWTTAILRRLVGDSGSVIGVELEPALVRQGLANLTDAGITDCPIEQAMPDVFGWPEGAPYDRILVSAMADRLPAELVDQLAEGGVLVIPVDGWMLRVRRTADGIETDRHGRYRFVPLR